MRLIMAMIAACVMLIGINIGMLHGANYELAGYLAGLEQYYVTTLIGWLVTPTQCLLAGLLMYKVAPNGKS